MPLSKEYRKVMQNRVTINTNKNLIISSGSKTLLITFFKNLIESESELETLKKKLTSASDFSAYELFYRIKKQFLNTGDKEELFQFLYDYKIVSKISEVDLIFERFDKDKDGKISYNEFLQEIIPKTLLDVIK
jgi:hypothetical protein